MSYTDSKVDRSILGPPPSLGHYAPQRGIGSKHSVSAPDDFRDFLARQTEAEAAFHQGDPGPRMEMWSRQDPVTLFGAAGMFTPDGMN